MRSGQAAAMAAFLAGGLLVASTAGAQASADDPMKACAAIEKRSARLECYDRAERGQPSEPPRPGSTRAREIAPVAAQPGATTAQTFGSTELKKTRQRRAPVGDRILVRTTSVSDNGIGHWRIGVEGGAVWEMTQAEPNFIPPRPGQLVRIRKGKVGGYLLDVGREGTVQVRRLQ